MPAETTTRPTAPCELGSGDVFDLQTLCARAAQRWGTRAALVFDATGEQLSFAELDARSNQVANALLAMGYRPGERVGLMLRNRPEWPLTWLGIVKAGLVMVPLNVYYKTMDAGYLLEHSGVGAVICERELLPLVRGAAQKTRANALREALAVDGDFAARVAAAGSEAPPHSARAETLANLQYTSGTTGPPKGCMLSHAWFLRFAQRMETAQFGLDARDTLFTAQPFYYVDPQWNLALSLLTGAQLVVADRFHPSTFWDALRRHGVTWFYCLGVMPRLLLKTPRRPDDRQHAVRWVACSAIPPGDHRAIETRWGVPWYEHFGMTESGLDIAVGIPEHDALVGSGCIGRPLPTREARVVDAHDRPLPRGQAGELVLRGPGLMDGYYRNPEATARIFRSGWLHTGDIARMDEAGRIYYVGREKDMIRRGGENIAAAEIEEVIMHHAQVKLAACVAVPDDTRGEEALAHVVLQPGATPESVTPQALIEFCRERVAYFKVPRYWRYRDDLPRTPSERVIKSALAERGEDPAAGAYDSVDDVWR